LEIKYLKHNQIDKQKWNAAIESAHNGLVYALSWFLDTVSPNWEALVIGDYDYIMPLTWRKKLSIKYLFQPIFIQQLGIFSEKKITSHIVNEFVSELTPLYKLIDIQLNYANPNDEINDFILRNTQAIDLSKPYSELYDNYKKNHRKNLIKLSNSGIVINSEGKIQDFIKLTREMFVNKGVEEIKAADIDHLERIVDYSLQVGIGELYFGYLDKKICSAAFFIKWKKRVIIYTALSKSGRDIGAMFGIIDKYLKENAGHDLIFDFAGSNIPGVKYRNLGFGARNDVYYRVTINNLPLPIKWLKK